MHTFEELDAISDLAKDLVAGGQRQAAGVLLKAGVETLQKSFDQDFLAETAAATRTLAKSRGVPFETVVKQHGNERTFIFKTGYHEVTHRRLGNEVQVTLRQTTPGPMPFKDLALAKAIQIKLQRVYAEMGDALMAKTEGLLKAGYGAGPSDADRAQAGQHLEAAKWHADQAGKAGQESPNGEKHYGRAVKHLGEHNRLAEAELHPRDLKLGSKDYSYRGFTSHAHDHLIGKQPLMSKAKVDDKKTAWLSDAKTPDAKRAIRANRASQPKDPLAGKKPIAKGLKSAVTSLAVGGAILGSMAATGTALKIHSKAPVAAQKQYHSVTTRDPAKPTHRTVEVKGLQKGDVVGMDPSKRRKPIEAPTAESAPAAVIGSLRSPKEHLDAMRHHVAHVYHHNEHQKVAEREGRHDDAARHEKLSDLHYAHALSHGNRIGRGKHHVAAMQGDIDRDMREAGYHPEMDSRVHLAFRPHPADSALGGRLVDPKTFNKSDAFLVTLAKALEHRRPIRVKRALGRKRRTQGVWSTHSRVKGGKQTQAAAAARRQTKATQAGSGVMGALASLFGG